MEIISDLSSYAWGCGAARVMGSSRRQCLDEITVDDNIANDYSRQHPLVSQETYESILFVYQRRENIVDRRNDQAD
jgi:hypothetical protein